MLFYSIYFSEVFRFNLLEDSFLVFFFYSKLLNADRGQTQPLAMPPRVPHFGGLRHPTEPQGQFLFGHRRLISQAP